jgi:Fe-S cluster biogenesis protein NfuA
MFIQTESTPNPNTLKFLPEEPVHPSGTAFYVNKEDATPSPLALRLFEVEDVRAVFLAGDFITVTKPESASWDVLKPLLLSAIMEHYLSGEPVIKAAAPTNPESRPTNPDSEIVTQIKELIETRVRPAVAQDGGDIIFHDFKDGVVELELHGACSGCPSSTATLKQGIENMLKHYVPEVLEVVAV